MRVAGGLDYLVKPDRKLLPGSEIHHYPRTDCDLFPDYFCWYREHFLATLPVVLKSRRERGVKPCRPLSTAVRYPRRLRDYRLADFCGRGVYVLSVMEGHGISYIHRCPWLSLAAGGAGDVLHGVCFISAPNCRTTRFTASVWKKG